MTRKELWLNEALEIKRHLNQFLRHPTREIKQIPDWPWHRILGLQIGIAALTGFLARLFEHKNIVSIIAGLILSPILTLITIGITSLFFYYCFQIFARKTVSLRKMFTVVLFASIPWFIIKILANYLPPLVPVGLAYADFLLVKGFIHNFQIDRLLSIKIVLTLFASIFVLWLWGQIASGDRWDRAWSSDRIEAPEVELGK